MAACKEAALAKRRYWHGLFGKTARFRDVVLAPCEGYVRGPGLNACLSVYPSVCLSVCLSIYLSIYLSVSTNM